MQSQACWRKLRCRFVAVIASCGLTSAIAAQAQDIDPFIRTWIERQHIPGAAVAVIKDGAVVKCEGYGFANVEHNVSARANTLFKIGSVSKQFIASGIMLLVQDGRIRLTDSADKYINGIPMAWKSITIRHLLTHTSGLVRESPGLDFATPQPDSAVIAASYSVPLLFSPGEKYEYSNLGYFVLAEVISRLIGKHWSDFLSERIFVPLGMTSTRLTSVADIVPNRASGYTLAEGKLHNAEDGPAVRPSGAFLSTVEDLAKWELALLSDKVLSAASKLAMWTPVTLNDGRKFPYGFGWQLDDWPANSAVSPSVPMIRHGGSMSGFRAGYTRWPSHALTVIILTNLSNAPYEGLGANIAIRYIPELRR